MIEVSIKVDTSRFDRMMSDFPAAMARAKRVALEEIGSLVERHAKDAIKGKAERPSPWAPRKKNYKHAPLLKSTTMWGNIKHRITGQDTVVIGTSAAYAPYHQLGTKKMRARPFFPVDKAGRLLPAVMRKIKAKIEAAYEAELRKLGR